MGLFENGIKVQDAVDLQDRSQISLAVSATAAQTGVLAEGSYDAWSDVDVYLKAGPTANDVTVNSGYLLRAGNTVTLAIRNKARLGAIAAAPGTLRLHQV